MHNKLVSIVEKKKQDLEEQKKVLSLEAIKKLSGAKEKTKEYKFKNIFLSMNCSISLIAEIKFASPTNSNLGSQEELLDRAKRYEEAGANAISLITERHYFKGEGRFISQVKGEVSIPVLQKDFVIDPYQIYEAKVFGSDSLLLIARLVDAKTLSRFVELCFAEGIEPVVEINSEEDLEKAISTESNIIAVNARDLDTFTIDISNAYMLIKKIPDRFIKLGFSGVSSYSEVSQYKNAGVQGVLIGTSLMQTNNIEGFIKNLKL